MYFAHSYDKYNQPYRIGVKLDVNSQFKNSLIEKPIKPNCKCEISKNQHTVFRRNTIYLRFRTGQTLRNLHTRIIYFLGGAKRTFYHEDSKNEVVGLNLYQNG